MYVCMYVCMCIYIYIYIYYSVAKRHFDPRAVAAMALAVCGVFFLELRGNRTDLVKCVYYLLNFGECLMFTFNKQILMCWFLFTKLSVLLSSSVCFLLRSWPGRSSSSSATSSRSRSRSASAFGRGG